MFHGHIIRLTVADSVMKPTIEFLFAFQHGGASLNEAPIAGGINLCRYELDPANNQA